MSWWKIGRDGRTDRLEQIESFSLSVVGINMHVQRFTSFVTGDCRVIPQRSSVVSLFSSPVSCYSAVDAQITCRECLIHFLTSLKINQRKQWHSKARKQRADPSPSHSFGWATSQNVWGSHWKNIHSQKTRELKNITNKKLQQVLSGTVKLPFLRSWQQEENVDRKK